MRPTLLQSPETASVAYFSMEVGLEPGIPTYSGGLGMLAGDTLRGGADLGVPMVGLSLLHRHGYFRQHLDEEGHQTESPAEWSPEEQVEEMPQRATLTLEGRPVQIRAWRYLVRGATEHLVPVYLLDTDLPQNDPVDRSITNDLYGGDSHNRLRQEAVLGLGGIAMLNALGHGAVDTYHLNEGHSALLALALLQEVAGRRGEVVPSEEDLEEVRQRCVFTTHTPVSAAHDQFPMELVRQVLGERQTDLLAALDCCIDHTLNMTYLALYLSRFVNGVAMRHGQVSRDMFPGYQVRAITNGVHAPTWTSPPFQDLFDRHLPEWRQQNLSLRYAVGMPLEEILQAHTEAKAQLLAEVERRTGARLDPGVFTLGFARRATPYKRHALLFSDLERLRAITRDRGPLQILFAGKAHPQDGGGKEMIHAVFRAAAELRPAIPVLYLEEYDMALGRALCAGVDLWLNTPQKPREASGTSGMKAALNGVPSLSVLDGWWIEGHVEGVTGWSIGDGWEEESDLQGEVRSLYDKLEEILSMFYRRPHDYARIMRAAVALNGSFFNAQRMVLQYVGAAYGL